MVWLGVDTGGTFTDFVCIDEGGGVRVHKVLSTPQAPERAILQGIAALGLQPHGLRLVHGSTVATNAALEGKGVRTVLLANKGFADLLSIGRQKRRSLYDLMPPVPPAPVPRDLCLEVDGRLGSDGKLLDALDGEQIEALRQRLEELAPQAVAVNLLFSYLDPAVEQRLRAAIPADCFVSLSSEVLPEIREYERGMATWLNAWVGPLVAGYLERLSAGLPGARVSVMQSSGETVAAGQAAQQAVRMLLSGPAGGLVGAQHVAARAGREQLLTFDMGGTSTDVALIDGQLQLTTEGHIGDYPVAVPMMDMHTIGAGGGSIAWLDAGGMLQLGPESAGADPGPACYGRGGKLPTVTDANLLLGRLQAEAFLGGDMHLDHAAAQAAMRPIASALDCDAVQAARAVIDVANAHMARALRAISIKRGVDARDFTLVSFGGAGGLHVCELACELGMHRVMVPVQGGVLSALGMLAAVPGRQLSQTLMLPLETGVEGPVEACIAELAGLASDEFAQEGVEQALLTRTASVDLRYRGQSYTLNLPWADAAASAEAFHRLHQARYGHRLDQPVELVTLRLAVTAPGSGFALPRREGSLGKPVSDRCQLPGNLEVPLWHREQLPPGTRLQGPAIVSEQVATTWLAEGWSCEVDDFGNLLLDRVSSC